MANAGHARRSSRTPRDPFEHRPTTASRRLLTVGVAAVAVLGVGLGSALWRPEPPVAVDPAAPGRLVATADAVDLGRVPLTAETEGRFELVNTGGKPVRLLGAPEVALLEGC